MEIRSATPADREVWFLMWRMFVEEQYQMGGTIKPESQTYRQYLDLYNSYTAGSLFGCVLLAEADGHPLGTMMGGESPSALNFSTTLGKAAIIWGVYTLPEYRQQGISKALLTRSKEIAIQLGFDSALSEILPHEHLWNNAKAIGAEVKSSTIHVSLKES